MKNLKNLPNNIIKRTQKAAVSLYLLNLALIMGTLGFGLPTALNKILKRKVETDKQNNTSNTASFHNKNMAEFLAK